MGRISEFETKIKPHLEDIEHWMVEYTEGQIAKMLGVSHKTFCKYKKKYPELIEALQKGTLNLKDTLKASLKKRAIGYYYEETETKQTENEKGVETVTKCVRRYSHPDVGAIHLLLKNIDPEWHNDDERTLRMKAKQLELDERRVENNEF